MNRYELTLWEKGYLYLCGVDEAGRGPLAGPVFAAAVILKKGTLIKGVKDSKKISEKARISLAKTIEKEALAYAVAYVKEDVIDQINILEATKKAMMEAINKLKIKPDFILIDYLKLNELKVESLSITKGDSLSNAIASASILAKVYRDNYMKMIAQVYPGYDFDIHKGYPTKKHLLLLRQKGISPIHRKSFKPVELLLKEKEEYNYGL